MKKNKHKIDSKKAFTLVELLIVIAIIGILTSIVLVSTRSGIDKAKKAAATTSASSALPEIVACQDDGGDLRAYAAGTVMCTASGHSATWPSMGSAQGWNMNAVATTGGISDTYTYNVSSATVTVNCNLSTSMCQ
jgi:type IV pilus assembly protein PilA